MKKGQTEIIGLMIIVILLILAGLFYVWFTISATPDESTLSSVKSNQAYNLMNAIMNTKLCENISIKDTITACDNNDLICNQNACSYLEQEIPIIVESSFYVNTAFIVLKDDSELLTIGECEFGPASPSYYFNKGQTDYEAYFKLC